MRGCGGDDAAAGAGWEAQGSGGSSWGWGPSEGTLALLGGKRSFHRLPPQPSSFFAVFFPSLPASYSCCLGEPALVREEAAFPGRAQGRGQLPLLQPASGGWRGDGKGRGNRQRMSTRVLGGEARLCGLGLTWLSWHCCDWRGCRERGTPAFERLSSKGGF